MLDLHPHTLRFYERMGFVTPGRDRGDTRRYSQQHLTQLRLILHLTREAGVNLAGVDVILRMRRQLEALQQEIESLRSGLRERLRHETESRVLTRALVKATPCTLVKVP